MNRGWIMTTRIGYENAAIHDCLKFYFQESKKVKLGPFRGPWEMKCGLPPGKDLRQRKKDLARRKDVYQIRDIIGRIFYKKKLRIPANNTTNLGWVRKPAE